MKTSSRFSILSFGAGAIGTYIGGSLALAGHRVVFIERPDVAADLRERGLRLDLSLEGRGVREIREGVAFVDSLEGALALGPFDVALFALKSYDTPAALDGMKPFVGQLPPVLCLQNGVDNEPAIIEALGPGKAIYGTVTSAVGRPRAGDIVLEKKRGVGVAAGHALSSTLAEALDHANLNCKLYPRAADMKWSKLLTNLLANPTSAILDMTAAEVFAHPGLYRAEIRQLRECLAVMRAQGIRVVDLPGTPVRALALAAYLPLWLSKPLLSKAAGAGRGAKMPSFHIDLHSGRGKSEVEYLHGAISRFGRLTGVPTPVNNLFTTTLLALTRGDIPLDTYARQPEKFLDLLK